MRLRKKLKEQCRKKVQRETEKIKRESRIRGEKGELCRGARLQPGETAKRSVNQAAFSTIEVQIPENTGLSRAHRNIFHVDPVEKWERNAKLDSDLNELR